MLRIMTLLASYVIGKSLSHAGGANEPTGFLFRLPLLMIRKILRLFLIGLGSLSVGVIGMGFFLKDLLFQIQTENQIVLGAAMGVSVLVLLAGFGVCAWTFRKENWIDAGDVTVPAEPMIAQEAQQPLDLMTVIGALVSDWLSSKANRRTSTL